jgi:hypothetical protein
MGWCWATTGSVSTIKKIPPLGGLGPPIKSQTIDSFRIKLAEPVEATSRLVSQSSKQKLLDKLGELDIA